MEALLDPGTVDIPDFNENKHMRCRFCPKFYDEGLKIFKITLKYKIIKVYEDIRSDPISMAIIKKIKLKCEPPFEVHLNYEVKDWLTNELNVRMSEANHNYSDSFIKIPVEQNIALSIDITSISEKSLTVKNVDLDIIHKDLIKKLGKNEFQQVDSLEE